ncbi:MAG: NAD(P)-binding domain-containing protein, partial [Candidatus Nanopelagicaceae bacterium]
MDTKVGIVGLGYVGLPLSVLFAEAGFNVIGYDLDSNKVNSLKEGRVYIDDISSDRYLRCAEGILATTNPED